MKNTFILLVSLFSISSIFLGVQAQTKPQPECLIGYYSVPPPPVCTTTTGPDGKPVKTCTAVGPGTMLGITNKDEPGFSEPNFPLLDIDWRGACRCSLWVYSSPNFKGFWKKYPFSLAKENKIVVSKIWKREAKSFKITCTF